VEIHFGCVEEWKSKKSLKWRERKDGEGRKEGKWWSLILSELNWFSTRLNLYLALDLIGKSSFEAPALQDNEYARFAAELHHVIEHQEPKWQGTVWRGVLHSPMEIVMMAIKGSLTPSFLLCPSPLT
jgi:hypothetical protein